MLGTVTSTIYCLMVVTAALRFGAAQAARGARGAGHRVSAAGERAEADARHRARHGTQSRDVLRAGVSGVRAAVLRAAGDRRGAQLAQQGGRALSPRESAKFVTCGEPTPQFHNAKVFSLAKLDSVAAHELFITSDADARVTKDYLRRMVQYLKRPQVGLASCVYLGTVDESEGKGAAVGAPRRGGQERGDDLGRDGRRHARRDEVRAGRDDVGPQEVVPGCRRVRGAGAVLRRRLRARQYAGEAGDGRAAGDACGSPAGGGPAVRGVVPQSAALDAEHAAVAAVGPLWLGADLRHAVRRAGPGVGAAERASAARAAVAAGHGGESLAAGRARCWA